jgi:hypothetical protein
MGFGAPLRSPSYILGYQPAKNEEPGHSNSGYNSSNYKSKSHKSGYKRRKDDSNSR